MVQPDGVAQRQAAGRDGPLASGLVGPLRWAVDLDGHHGHVGNNASVHIDGPKPIGPYHDDQALRAGTAVYVGSRRGEYRSFEKKTFGANLHTIRFDDGSTETLKLKDVSDWRFACK
eukprot:COSAG04_NODE_897_length_9581_cov_96.260599_8_plen_117_part_00